VGFGFEVCWNFKIRGQVSGCEFLFRKISELINRFFEASVWVGVVLHDMVVIFTENVKSGVDIRFRGIRSAVSCQKLCKSSTLISVRVRNLKIVIELACKLGRPSKKNLV